MTEQGMTDKEAESMLRNISEGRQNMHSFFTKIIHKDQKTLKVGNLDEEELGKSKLPQRTYLELSTFCKEIADDDDFSGYFDKIAEIQTASSLSKDGFLMKLAVTMKKELADVSPKKAKPNKGWFKKKGGEVPPQ